MLLHTLSDESGSSAIGAVNQDLITALQLSQANEDRWPLV
jgi:hypothetical protein